MQIIVDLAQVVRDLVTAIALIIGGGFAYFKFVRGRTFTERLEASVDARLDSTRNLLLVNASAQATNIGLREFHLAREGTALRLFVHRLSEPGSEASEASWELVGSWRVFGEQEILEPGEALQEFKVIETSATGFAAFKLELDVYSSSGRNWLAQTVVSGDVAGDNS